MERDKKNSDEQNEDELKEDNAVLDRIEETKNDQNTKDTEHADEWSEYLSNTPEGWDEYWQKYSNQLVWHDWCQKFPQMLTEYQEITYQSFEGLYVTHKLMLENMRS